MDVDKDNSLTKDEWNAKIDELDEEVDLPRHFYYIDSYDGEIDD